MSSIELNSLSYAKIICHLFKYQHCSVNGLLLGSIKDDVILIADVYPLFHTAKGLTPMLEIALIQLDTTFKRDYSLVGLYHANESTLNESLNSISEKVVEKLQEYFKHAFLMMVNNAGLSRIDIEKSDLPLNAYTKVDGHLRLSKMAITCTDHHKVSEKIINGKLYLELTDFDDHLEDVKKDWSNTNIAKLF